MNTTNYQALNNPIDKKVKSEFVHRNSPKQKTEFNNDNTHQIINIINITTSVKQFPFKLEFLLSIQKGFTVLTVGLISIMLGIYACTANKTIEWNKKYFELQNLKKYEIPLASFSESLKYTIAEKAKDPNSKLVPPDPHTSLLFLSPVNIPDTGDSIQYETKNITD